MLNPQDYGLTRKNTSNVCGWVSDSLLPASEIKNGRNEHSDRFRLTKFNIEERGTGIGPASQAWEARTLPMC